SCQIILLPTCLSKGEAYAICEAIQEFANQSPIALQVVDRVSQVMIINDLCSPLNLVSVLLYIRETEVRARN
ncbi:MAG: hypothetical protein ABJA60_07470, partial [Nitrosospira sp.]